jgi:hypothetical protein
MNVDFGALIKRSFDIAWKYKSLWIFGLFAGGGGNFNFDWTDKVERHDIDMSFAYNLFDRLGLPTDFIPPEFAVIGALLAWVLALVLLFFICYLIAQPAIIDGINKITRGGVYTFRSSFSRGTDFFWRFFGLTLVAIFAFLVSLVAVVVVPAFLTPFTLILTIPAWLVVGFFLMHTFGLAEIAMVARDNQIADAIAEGWTLVTHNKANCFILSLIWIGLAIAFFIVFGIAALVFYLPINLLVYALTGNLVAILLLALFIGLPVALVLGGYSGTFFNAYYVQFYFNLVDPPQPVAVAAAPTGSPGQTM